MSKSPRPIASNILTSSRCSSIILMTADVLDRRRLSFFGFNLANAAAYASGIEQPRPRRFAKSAIMIWLSGGASHIDTWDMKPDAVAEYRGPFRPAPTSAPASCCANTCRISRARRIISPSSVPWAIAVAAPAIIMPATITISPARPGRSFHQLLNARTPYPTDWPSMAAVVALKRPLHPFLPNTITLPTRRALRNIRGQASFPPAGDRV